MLINIISIQLHMILFDIEQVEIIIIF
jgi:hypothetical protein